MAGRRTNLVLLVLLAAAFVTGALSYALGTGWNRWAVVAHAVAGAAILLVSPLKSVIARRGLRRRRSGRPASVALTVLVVAAIVFGVLHSTGILVHLGPVTAMQVHVGAAIASIPLALWHVVARRVRLHRSDLGRRQLLHAGALLGGATALYAGLEAVVHVASLPGADRRMTGSFERGSFDPDAMPVTQWLNDSVPAVDAGAWRLHVRSGDFEKVWSYEDLAAFDDTVVAVLDCTGGWYATQKWTGVWLERLLDGASGRSIAVGSVTGYGRRLPLSEASRVLLATRVDGRPLSAGHGFPLRLVAPGRRGFWWVKWVEKIEVSDVPWWRQSPFPLT